MGWLRNYGAMGDEKLMRTVEQFDKGYGEAVNRVRAKGGDMDENMAKCRYEARKRGLLEYGSDTLPEGTVVYTAAQFCPECEKKKKFVIDDYICHECREIIG